MKETKIGIIRDGSARAVVLKREGQNEVVYPTFCEVNLDAIIGKKVEVTLEDSKNEGDRSFPHFVITSIILL